MSDSSKIGDGGKGAQKARRERRLAAALRENLKRRKAQTKGRRADRAVELSAQPHDSAGIADDKRNNPLPFASPLAGEGAGAAPFGANRHRR